MELVESVSYYILYYISLPICDQIIWVLDFLSTIIAQRLPYTYFSYDILLTIYLNTYMYV